MANDGPQGERGRVYRQYKRTAVSEMADWHEGFDMAGVSISEADTKAGSPKPGDKIARNPANHDDRWLVAADYFAANFALRGQRDHEVIRLDPVGRYVVRCGAAALPELLTGIEIMNAIRRVPPENEAVPFIEGDGKGECWWCGLTLTQQYVSTDLGPCCSNVCAHALAEDTRAPSVEER